MTTQTVTIPALFGGSFTAYLATPSTQPCAGIVLTQEVLGVNKNMRQTADDFAKAGYWVLVQLFAKTQQIFGKLGILVNNAAIYQSQSLNLIPI
jgi:dienelactone hydrolase